MRLDILLAGLMAGAVVGCLPATRPNAISVSPDGRGFVEQPGGRPFVPWGFNYDHDENLRLIEDYWVDEWPKIEADFAEMRALGANVVRVHLQFSRFMRSATEPDAAALGRLANLLALAERLEVQLDLTGLGCYRAADVPAWYDALDEPQRWAAQARFWEAVAARCAASPAVFCYDLMNEPVVAAAPRGAAGWLGPPFAGFCYVQFINLEPRERSRPAIAQAWIRTLVTAIRRHDARHLITVGLVDWSLDRPGLTSGFVPAEVAPELDFLCVHIYPEAACLPMALETLNGFAAVGRPVVLEELFPLHCSLEEMRTFLRASRGSAAGWISFYWGRTLAEYRRSPRLEDQVVAAWLQVFQQERAALLDAPHPNLFR